MDPYERKNFLSSDFPVLSEKLNSNSTNTLGANLCPRVYWGSIK